MKTKKSFRQGLLIACVCFPFLVFGQYTGGADDGASSSSFCASDLNGSTSAVLSIGAISGQATFCSLSSDTYSVALISGTADTFIWSLPTGSTILYALNTPTSSIVTINFGSTSGNIVVTASNSCSTTSASPLAVSSTSCGQFLGASNDGFSTGSFCGGDLSGGAGPAILLSSIGGSITFCSLGSDVYSITATSGTVNSFIWSLPTGASIIYSLTTPTSSIVSINFGNTSGSISVTASNSCSTVTSSSLSVSNIACNQYLGGNDDGFTNALFCGSNLTGGSLGIISLSAISGVTNFCFNGSQNYSVNVSSGIATSFSWTTPTGGSTLAIQNGTTSSIASLGFGVTNGSIQVTAGNGCSTSTASLAVTGQNCNITLGGSNDGFGSAIYCGLDLAGTGLGPITLSAIVSTGNYCINLGQTYSVSASSGLATSFSWTATVGAGTAAGSLSTTTTSLASISFPGASGTIQVDATNGCFSDSKTLAVTGVSCDIALGGTDDGFSTTTFCGSNLTGGSPGVVSLNPISGNDFCFNLGQPYSVTAVGGNPSSFVWSVAVGIGSTNSLSSNFNASTASMSFTSGSATVQVVASNGCTSDSKTILVNGSTCNQALGGNDDGFSTVIFCGSNLTGGILAPIALSAISGNPNFCFNLGQNYSVSVTTGVANLFSWSAPTGAGAYAQSSTFTTSLASINFVGTSGNVSVSATNGCSTAIALLAVTGQNCDASLGSTNDGYSSLSFCGSDLTGGLVSALALNPLSGSGTVCFNLGDTYSVTTSAGTATTYVWSLPAGAAQTTSKNTLTSSIASVLFANAGGTVSVTASNPCYSDTKNLIVSGINCLMSLGGSNDGFAFGQVTNTPLPVTLVFFAANQNGTAVDLIWQTASEQNNDYFTIEKSTDGMLFTSISTVPGAGTTNTQKNYLYVDHQPFLGVSYYRLKQTDFDGRFEYSAVVSVEFDGPTDNFNAEIYPNPTLTSSFNIRFNSMWEGSEAIIEIMDVTGRKVFQSTFICSSSTPVKAPSEAPLKPGIYIIKIYVADKKLIDRLVVQ